MTHFTSLSIRLLAPFTFRKIICKIIKRSVHFVVKVSAEVHYSCTGAVPLQTPGQKYSTYFTVP